MPRSHASWRRQRAMLMRLLIIDVIAPPLLSSLFHNRTQNTRWQTPRPWQAASSSNSQLTKAHRKQRHSSRHGRSVQGAPGCGLRMFLARSENTIKRVRYPHDHPLFLLCWLGAMSEILSGWCGCVWAPERTKFCKHQRHVILLGGFVPPAAMLEGGQSQADVIITRSQCKEHLLYGPAGWVNPCLSRACLLHGRPTHYQKQQHEPAHRHILSQSSPCAREVPQRSPTPFHFTASLLQANAKASKHARTQNTQDACIGKRNSRLPCCPRACSALSGPIGKQLA